jgi:hypothetical protein
MNIFKTSDALPSQSPEGCAYGHPCVWLICISRAPIALLVLSREGDGDGWEFSVHRLEPVLRFLVFWVFCSESDRKFIRKFIIFSQ